MGKKRTIIFAALTVASAFGQGTQNQVQTGLVDAHGASWRFPESTFAALPAAVAGNTGWRYTVTDCLTSACTAGSGTTKADLRSNGTIWEVISGGGGSTYAGCTSDGANGISCTGGVATGSGGSAAGFSALGQGTAPTFGASAGQVPTAGYNGWTGAASGVTTSWLGQLPVAVPAANQIMLFPAPTSGIAQSTWVGISGSGSVCMSTSCVMTTPALGTPSALVLTNATGLPTKWATAKIGGFMVGSENASAALVTADLTNHAFAVNDANAKTLVEASCVSDAGSQAVTVKIGGTTLFSITCVAPGSYSTGTTNGTTGYIIAASMGSTAVGAHTMLDLSGTANTTTKSVVLHIYGSIN